MNVRNVWIIFRKELTDILRDRRTLIFMVALPILVIPGLLWLMNKFVESGVQRLREEASIIAVVGAEEGPSVVKLLKAFENLSDDPQLLANVGDPLLESGLMNMLSADESADAMLVASAMAQAPSEEQLERLGSVRFVRVVDFEPRGEAAALFAEGRPDLLRDGARLRLAATALALREAGEDGADKLVEGDPAMIADRQRIEGLSDAERRRLEEDVARLEVLRRAVTAGIKARDFHAVLVLHDDFDQALHNDGTARFTMLYDESQEKSEVAEGKVTRLLDRLSQGIVRARVSSHGLKRSLLDPFKAESLNLGRERSILAMFLPYMVILMCFAGAIYPALDLGAGEKERGTLETLLVTPASRLELVLGKFAVVSLTALVAALLNIASLTTSMKLGIVDFGAGGGGLVFDPRAAIVSFALMLPVAALFAAVLMAVSIFAKSFKEAQSYTAPINMVVIVPAIFSFIPGVELTIPLSLVPLVNVTLALKEAWAGIFKWDCLAVLAISSLAYAALALLFCVWWFQREEVLFRT
ncbi:MAG: ABC transporter permease [Acidobacteria bacterium]|nr:MAG: ABC transporter permease [Acidobacteriota bacterium]